MKKYLLLIFLLVAVEKNCAQYLKKEYPLVLTHVNNGLFNIRTSFSRNTDMEGASFLNFEMPSLSFSADQSPIDHRNFVFSLNPIIWAISTLTTSGEMLNTGGGMPFINDLLEGIPNFRLEISLYPKRVFLVFGPNIDYLIGNKGLGARGGFSSGIKIPLDRVSLRIMYNIESMGLLNTNEYVTHAGLRLDLSYDFGPHSFASYIYHCGVRD
jgi:hypothetical protein